MYKNSAVKFKVKPFCLWRPRLPFVQPDITFGGEITDKIKNEYPQAYNSIHLLICWYSRLNIKGIGQKNRVVIGYEMSSALTARAWKSRLI